jgi:predicted CXXCH cytochrome family protein
MTQVPRADNVLGDFEGVRLDYFGQSYLLERRGDELWVRSRGDERRVVLMTGSHHYQLYWLPSREGAGLESFPFVYLKDDKRWAPRAAAFLEPPEHELSPEKPRVWNVTCIECHSTYGQPRIAPDGRHMDTKVAELGISCEACHGPGAEHARFYRDPLRRYRAHLGGAAGASMVNPARSEARVGSEICGQCHSIFASFEYQAKGEKNEWLRRGSPYRAGGDLSKTRFIARHPAKAGEEHLKRLMGNRKVETAGYFWKDGMVRVSGREYNGLIESPCYQRGHLSCLSCHSMHGSDPDDQLKAGMDGDEACLQCHEAFRSRLEEHSHHQRASSGSRCQNCHMPHATYGLLKAIENHEIDSPSAQTSLQSGRPNACNLCHLDRSLSWTARYLRDWHGISTGAMPRDEESISAAILWLLRGDAGQRAILAWHLGWPPALEASGADWPAPFLARLLEDPYAAVRYLAYRSLRKLEGYHGFAFDYVGPPAGRAEARERALGAWKGPAADRGPRRAELLLRPDGQLMRDEIERLIKERDDHPVELLE